MNLSDQSMSFTAQVKSMLTRSGLVVVFSSLIGGFSWILHFVIEFSVLNSAEMSPYFIIFHLVAVAIGSLFYLFFSSKINQTVNILISSTVLTLSLSVLVLTTEPLLVVIFLTIAGFNIGNLLPTLYIAPSSFLQKPEYNGRLNFISLITISIIAVIAVIIDFFAYDLLFVAYIVFLLLIVILTYSLGKDEFTLPSRKQPLKFYFRSEIFPYPVVLLSFFLGFFFINIYYASIIILNNSGLLDDFSNFNLFILVFLLTCIIISFPSGFLYDKIGRRWSILIGFYLNATTFFIIVILPEAFTGFNEEFLLLTIFPILLGVGFSLSLFGGFLVVSYELAPKKHLISHNGVTWAIFGVGMVTGVFTGESLKELIAIQPMILPTVMIFAYFTATLLIFQLEEPLPPREEIEWRRKIAHILVLNKIGVPLYSQSMQESNLDTHSALVSGAIVGISYVVNEITKASNLKVIKQEKYCIMLEEGSDTIMAVMITQELSVVRKKMLNFLDDFETFFEDFLKDPLIDSKVFIPSKHLVERHFG